MLPAAEAARGPESSQLSVTAKGDSSAPCHRMSDSTRPQRHLRRRTRGANLSALIAMVLTLTHNRLVDHPLGLAKAQQPHKGITSRDLPSLKLTTMATRQSDAVLLEQSVSQNEPSELIRSECCSRWPRLGNSPVLPKRKNEPCEYCHPSGSTNPKQMSHLVPGTRGRGAAHSLRERASDLLPSSQQSAEVLIFQTLGLTGPAAALEAPVPGPLCRSLLLALPACSTELDSVGGS